MLQEFSQQFFRWLDSIQREEKTKVYYRDGWRLLSATDVNQYALGSNHQRRCRNIAVSRLTVQC